MQKIDVILSLQSIGVVFIFFAITNIQIFCFAFLFFNFSTSKLNYIDFDD